MIKSTLAEIHFRENTVSPIDYRGSQESWNKSQFRKTPRWLNFCKRLIEERGHQCERCHVPDDLVVHHRDPMRYEVLLPELFVVLCNRCHLVIESQCRTQEEMDRHPENRKYHTLYPYKYDAVKWQSGTGTVNRWVREYKSEINRPESVPKKKQITEAVEFMKQHPELFT